MDMLQSLTDMKLATKIIEKASLSSDNVIDSNYKSLNNVITNLEPSS